jgi:hypothetical protein
MLNLLPIYLIFRLENYNYIEKKSLIVLCKQTISHNYYLISTTNECICYSELLKFEYESLLFNIYS